MKIEKISINGKILNPDQATIKATDQGLMYGVNAFESLRVHAGKAFLLSEHFDRLEKSLSAIDIELDKNRQECYSLISNLCSDMPGHTDAFVRFVVTGGSEVLGVSDRKLSSPTVIIYMGYIPPFSPAAKQAVILKNIWRAKPEYFTETGFRIKSMDYISARFAKRQLAKTGEGLDGILLTPEGHIAEGLTSNIFWSKDSKLYTPPLSTGILSGTVRAYLMSNNNVNEVLASANELEEADEILFSSGSSYLNPLSKINGINKPGINGLIFKKLYNQLLLDIKNSSSSLD